MDPIVSQQLLSGIQAAARQSNMAGKVFSTSNDPGNVPDRKSQRLDFEKLRVLKSRQSNQAIGQRLRQLLLFGPRQLSWPAH